MMSQILPGGRYTAINIPLRLLIMNSYRLQEPQLVGAPTGFHPSDSTSSRRPKVIWSAGVRDGGPSKSAVDDASPARGAFQAEVASRAREVPIYSLVLARRRKLGPELKPSTVDCEALAAARKQGGAT